MIEQSIKLNLIPSGVKPHIRVSQYDNESRTLKFSLYEGTSPFFVPTGATVQIRGTKPDKHGFEYTATWMSATVTVNIKQQMTAVAGAVECELVIIKDTKVLGTANFILDVEKAALGEDVDISDTEIPDIIDAAESNSLKAEGFAVGEQDGTAVESDSPYYHNNAKYYAEQASGAEQAAEEAEAEALKSEGFAVGQQDGTDVTSESPYYQNNSKYYKEQAASSATTATTKAGEASSSASTASTKATAADTSAKTAEAWAVGTKDGTAVPSTDPQYHNNAKYWSDKAQEYAVGAVHYKSAVTFASIPTTGMANGDMYNVTDSFTTDSRFSEGAGKYCEAGTNIIWDGTLSLWDLGGGLGGVQSFNNRHGAIAPVAGDYTAAMTGAVDKTGDTMTGALSVIGNERTITNSQTASISRIRVSVSDEVEVTKGSVVSVYPMIYGEVGCMVYIYDSTATTLIDSAYIAIDDEREFTYGTAQTFTLKIDAVRVSTVSGEIVDADGNVLSAKQNKTLDTPIVVDGVTYTDLEDAMNAINENGGGGGDVLIKGFKEKTWTGYANLNSAPWVDVDGTVYYSNGSNQYELDKATGNWSRKTWQGVTSFSAGTIWNDGVHTYMSSGTTQYELTDRTTGTWTAKTWEGLTNFSAGDIWSDGTDIYYDSGNVHYIYDKNNASWSVNTWTGVSSFQGRNVWTDGEKVYLSNTASQQLELDVATKTWSSKTWTCPNIANFYGERVWSDGEDIFYSYAGTISYQWVLDKATSTWYEKTWIGAPANKVSAGSIWTDGSAYYISNGSSAQYVLSEYTIEELLGIPYGIATLNEDGRIPLEQTNYVNAGRKSNTTVGNKSTAEGQNATSSAACTHAEGNGTSATDTAAHAEGQQTIASGGQSHAEGANTTASGHQAHAEGSSTTASHQASHAEGQNTKTGNNYQHVQGKYNVGNSTTAFEIGNGTANNARSNAFEVEWDGDTIAAGEITDGGGNVLSDKYDATSLVFVNERFTISASGWSSTQTSGYYTYTLSTGNTKYNTYSDVTMANVGVDDSTDATSAEKAAYALVNKFDMADGTGVDSFTLYAKTKPTTTFYIKLSGRYMAKNAASSTKALDIETANPLMIADADGNAIRFDGSEYCMLEYNNYLKMIPSGNWTSTVDSDGYYTNTLSVIPFNTYNGVDVRLSGSTIDTLPTAAQIAAYNLVDIFYMDNDTNAHTLVVKARTKPTTDFYVTLKGSYID